MKVENDNILNIFDFCEGTKVLGTGLRFVIWVQGCTFKCKGCISPYGQEIKENILVDINILAQSIIKNKSIEGITISGGEPFLQVSKLNKLLKIIKEQRPALNIIVFTGFELEDLDWDEAKEFLQFIDVLIDGKYIEELNDNKGLRGSSNQRVHFLTNRLIQYKEIFENNDRNAEIIVDNNYKKIIGIPNKSVINSI